MRRGLPCRPRSCISTAPRAARSRRPTKVIVDQRDKVFVPEVTVVQTGTDISFPNSDSVSHHVYSFAQPNSFELPLYKGGTRPLVRFDHPGVVTLGCNIHDSMIGYIVVVETPHFGTTDAQGTVTLPDVPAGSYQVQVWSPRLDPSKAVAGGSLTVGPGAAVAAGHSGPQAAGLSPPVAARWWRETTDGAHLRRADAGWPQRQRAEESDRNALTGAMDLSWILADSELPSWLEHGNGKLRFDEEHDGLRFFAHVSRLSRAARLHAECPRDAQRQRRYVPEARLHRGLSRVAAIAPQRLAPARPGSAASIRSCRSRTRMPAGAAPTACRRQSSTPGSARNCASSVPSCAPPGTSAAGRNSISPSKAACSTATTRPARCSRGAAGRPMTGRPGFNGSVPMPAVPAIEPWDEEGEPPRNFDPFQEIDHHPGFYGGVEWQWGDRARIKYMHYDNHADPDGGNFRRGLCLADLVRSRRRLGGAARRFRAARPVDQGQHALGREALRPLARRGPGFRGIVPDADARVRQASGLGALRVVRFAALQRSGRLHEQGRGQRVGGQLPLPVHRSASGSARNISRSPPSTASVGRALRLGCRTACRAPRARTRCRSPCAGASTPASSPSPPRRCACAAPRPAARRTRPPCRPSCSTPSPMPG